MSNEEPERIMFCIKEDQILPLSIEVFRKDLRAKLPIRGTSGSVGFDIHAFLLTETGRPSKRMLSRMNTTMIPTGLVLRPPKGYFLQVCSRSGLATKAIFVANSPGIIDPDYTGELMILLFNGGYETQWIEHEHRIAQIVLSKIQPSEITEITSSPEPLGRGLAGFGSTGL